MPARLERPNGLLGVKAVRSADVNRPNSIVGQQIIKTGVRSGGAETIAKGLGSCKIPGLEGDEFA